MVQYEGFITKNGELLVNLEGMTVSLREFLQAKRLTARRERRRAAGEGQSARGESLAMAK